MMMVVQKFPVIPAMSAMLCAIIVQRILEPTQRLGRLAKQVEQQESIEKKNKSIHHVLEATRPASTRKMDHPIPPGAVDAS